MFLYRLEKCASTDQRLTFACRCSTIAFFMQNRPHSGSRNPRLGCCSIVILRAYSASLVMSWSTYSHDKLQRHTTRLILTDRQTVASPGFIARRGKYGNIMSWSTHGDIAAGCSSCSMTNSLATNTVAVLIERTASCWHLHQLISQTTKYLDEPSWLSDLIQSKLKMKFLEVEGGHVPQCPIVGDATADRRKQTSLLLN